MVRSAEAAPRFRQLFCIASGVFIPYYRLLSARGPALQGPRGGSAPTRRDPFVSDRPPAGVITKGMILIWGMICYDLIATPGAPYPPPLPPGVAFSS